MITNARWLEWQRHDPIYGPPEDYDPEDESFWEMADEWLDHTWPCPVCGVLLGAGDTLPCRVDYGTCPIGETS